MWCFFHFNNSRGDEKCLIFANALASARYALYSWLLAGIAILGEIELA